MNGLNQIAINTGGGDAPGLNAEIHAVVHAARNLDWPVVGIRKGLDGPGNDHTTRKRAPTEPRRSAGRRSTVHSLS